MYVSDLQTFFFFFFWYKWLKNCLLCSLSDVSNGHNFSIVPFVFLYGLYLRGVQKNIRARTLSALPWVPVWWVFAEGEVCWSQGLPILILVFIRRPLGGFHWLSSGEGPSESAFLPNWYSRTSSEASAHFCSVAFLLLGFVIAVLLCISCPLCWEVYKQTQVPPNKTGRIRSGL